MKKIPWTEEMVARFRQLCLGKKSYGKIADVMAEEFGVVLTRNAIIGKAHRLGIQRAVTPTQMQKKPRRMKPVVRKPREPAPPEPAPVERRTMIPIEELTYGACRYPHGQQPPYLFCGEATAAGSSWCPAHCERVFTKGYIR